MKYISYFKHVIGSTILRPVYFFARRDSKLSLLLAFIFSIKIKFYRRLRLLPVDWLDEKKNAVITKLEQQELSYSYGPKDISGNHCVLQVQLPAVNLYHFKNAGVSVLSSSILLDNKIIIERVEGVEVRRCDYSAGHVIMHGQKSALVRNLQMEHIEQGIFLGGNGSSNYYHWMIEIMPKLKYLNELDKHGYESFPLLVNEDVRDIKTFRETLNSIAKNRPIVMLDIDKTYYVSELVYINAPNNLPFNLRQNEKMRITDFLTRPASISFLQNRLCTSVDPAPLANRRRRIFFARSTERRNYNHREIFEIFRQQGFQEVFMETLCLKEQIALVSNAEMIAGPTGAAWTNLIFCQKGTKCLCWMDEGLGAFSAFSNLAGIVGADMRYLTFKTDAKSSRDLYYGNYSINVKIIKQGLDVLLGVTV